MAKRAARGLTLLVAAVFAYLPISPALADWQPDPSDRAEQRAARAIADIRTRLPDTAPYFDDAWGYAILPSITRVGFGFGGAWGNNGIVIEQDNVVGTTGYWQFTSGIQAGAKNFSMIIFFRDKDAIDNFKSRATQFMGQAGLALGTLGVDGTPGYNRGVAVFAVTRLGLMGEFTISGVKFTFTPRRREESVGR